MTMEQIIIEAKKKTIKDLGNLKFDFSICRILTKAKLIKMFKDFKKEDFSCFAKDGNTYLNPEEYYEKITLKKLEGEYESMRHQQSFHQIDGELGINLLKCCDECKSLFLENEFKINVYNLIKKLKEDHA